MAGKHQIYCTHLRIYLGSGHNMSSSGSNVKGLFPICFSYDATSHYWGWEVGKERTRVSRQCWFESEITTLSKAKMRWGIVFILFACTEFLLLETSPICIRRDDFSQDRLQSTWIRKGTRTLHQVLKNHLEQKAAKISVKGKISNILGFVNLEAKMRMLCRQNIIKENNFQIFDKIQNVTI